MIGSVCDHVAMSADTDDTLLPPALGTDRLAPPLAGDLQGFARVDSAYYRMEEEIARGGMGRIRRARDRRLGRDVAVKELVADTSELRMRFEREARITAHLQHPAIVNVHEAGTWANGQPFYAMKLVEGRALSDAIRDTRTFAERMALLSNVSAMVDALAYAHHQRVIHRDLKPANVLVGAFGETVVIDWGLAKELGAASDDIPSAASNATSADRTVAGSVMGTPAYMPPEQARGEPVGTRADVYSLGAIIYTLFAGAAPYEGPTATVLENVQAGPPVPLEHRAPDVPRDLLAIVEKAMAREPTDRYRDASELALDLKRFQTGQLVGAHAYSLGQLLRRWVRRHRTAIGVAGVGTVALAVVGVLAIRNIVDERQRTELQRELAERNRAAADELTDFMLFELREKLEPLDKLDLLDAVAQKASRYYADLPTTAPARELRKRAAALENLGEVLAHQGKLAEALAQHRAALAIRQPLSAQMPDDEVRSELASSIEHIAEVVGAQGDDARSLAGLREAFAIRAQLAARAPTNARFQAALATSHDRIGIAISHREPERALAEYRTARAIRHALAANDPENLAWQRALSESHERLGDRFYHEGKLADALREFRACKAIAERLVQREPDNLGLLRDLELCHDRIGNVSLKQEDFARALAEYRAALDIATRRYALDPTNVSTLRSLSIRKERIGDVLLEMGDPAGALAAYRPVMEIRTQLTQRDSTNATWRRELAWSHEFIGDAQLAARHPDEAIAEYRKALAIRNRLTADDPAATYYQRDLAVCREKLGTALLARDEVAAARDEYRASRTIRDKLLAGEPAKPTRMRDVSIIHHRIGTLLARSDREAALAEYRRARELARKTVTAEPSNTLWQRELAGLEYAIGELLVAKRDHAGAAGAFAAIHDGLLAFVPDSAARREAVITGHEQLGDALVASGDARGAGDAYHRAWSLVDKVGDRARALRLEAKRNRLTR
jgi:tetratricopeptide (TPR) repeat protein